MKLFTNFKLKNIFVFILSIVILFSLPCVAYAEIDFADNVLTSGIEIQVKANVDPEIQGDILVWVSNMDEHFDTYTTLYAHNNYTQTIYVKNPGKYQITSVSYNGMLTSDHQVEYKEIEVVSGITNHLIFSIGNPVTNEDASVETSSEMLTTEVSNFDDIDNLEGIYNTQNEDSDLEDDSSSSKKLSISSDVIISIIAIVVIIGVTIAFSIFWLKRSKK